MLRSRGHCRRAIRRLGEVADEHTYAAAGVSLATADAIVERLREAVDSTATPGVTGGFGSFAGLFAVDEHRLLAASMDSVGSKLVLARRTGKLRWCGADLAAHCINDVLTTGAEPLFLLDDVRGWRERADVRALAHVTGGGIAGNLARCLPEGLGAVVDPSAWARPPVFAWLAEQGVPEQELRRVFNVGIGYCAVVPSADV